MSDNTVRRRQWLSQVEDKFHQVELATKLLPTYEHGTVIKSLVDEPGVYSICGVTLRYTPLDTYWFVDVPACGRQDHCPVAMKMFIDETEVTKGFIYNRLIAARAVGPVCFFHRVNKVGALYSRVNEIKLRWIRCYSNKPIRVDREFNDLPIPTPEYPDLHKTPLVNVDNLNIELYNKFEEKLNQSMRQQAISCPIGKLTAPVDGSMFDIDLLIQPYIKREIKYSGSFVDCVVWLPKHGAVTSDGKLRNVYCPSNNLLNFFETTHGNKQPHHSNLCRHKTYDLHKCRKSQFVTYDLVKADRQVYPYYLRYVLNNIPAAEWKFYLPLVVVKAGHFPICGYIHGLCSGLPVMTNLVVPAMLSAVVELAGLKKTCYQGDAIATPTPVPQVEEYLQFHKRNDQVFNGFNYATGQPRYWNALSRLSRPRVIVPGALNGNIKFDFLREIYARLGAPSYMLPPPRSAQFAAQIAKYTNKQLHQMNPTSHVSYLLKYADWNRPTASIDNTPHNLDLADKVLLPNVSD